MSVYDSNNVCNCSYDVCIIGAGVIGCAIARELSKYNVKVCLIEKSDDVANGTSKANSGIVHGGYNEKHGSIKAKFSLAGNRMFAQLDKELNFGFNQIGSLLIGFNSQDAEEIQKIYANGIKNGVDCLEIIDENIVRTKEPFLNKDIKLALYCKKSGVTSPYELTIALAENAITNGVTLKLNHEVIAIKQHTVHDFSVFTNNHLTQTEQQIKCRCIVNCAGLYADDIARLVGINDFTITPRQGQYLLFDKDQGHLVNSVIFQVPTAISKGILVTPTQHGNLLIGPDATTVDNKHYLDTQNTNIQDIVATAKQSLPEFDLRKVITSFAGNRASPSTGDFIIEEHTIVKGFINVAGIESPGLTASPAIGKYVTEMLADILKFSLNIKPDFIFERPAYKTIANMSEEELAQLIKQDQSYGRVICRCEMVSEGEILDALRRCIPIRSIDAIKRRTRAGMGRCQAGFCTPHIMEIMARELNLSQTELTKKGSNSAMVMAKTKQALEQ